MSTFSMNLTKDAVRPLRAPIQLELEDSSEVDGPPSVGSCMGQYMFRTASQGRTQQLAKIILCGVVDLEWRNAWGETSLYAAAEMGRSVCVAQLLKAGSIVDARNTYGSTPLLAAVYWGHEECVRLLLTAAADPEAVATNGKTAKDIAMNRYRTTPSSWVGAQ